LYYIVVISIFYVPFICSEKRSSCVEQINILFFFFRISLSFLFFLLFPIHILICITVATTARGRMPSINYNSLQVFCKTHGTFSFNIAFCPFPTVTKFIVQSVLVLRTSPFVRLTRSFARRIRTTFTKPTFIWIGEVAFLHTRRHRHTRPFYARFLWNREHSHVSLHLQSHHCPEVQSHETIFILIYCSLA